MSTMIYVYSNHVCDLFASLKFSKTLTFHVDDDSFLFICFVRRRYLSSTRRGVLIMRQIQQALFTPHFLGASSDWGRTCISITQLPGRVDCYFILLLIIKPKSSVCTCHRGARTVAMGHALILRLRSCFMCQGCCASASTPSGTGRL